MAPQTPHLSLQTDTPSSIQESPLLPPHNSQDTLTDPELTQIPAATTRTSQRRFIPIGLNWTQSNVPPVSYNEILRAMFPNLANEHLHSQNSQHNQQQQQQNHHQQHENPRMENYSQPLDRLTHQRRTRQNLRLATNQSRRNQNQGNPSIHPQFRAKSVCKLFCKHCTTDLCERGMKAILLGNTRVELFSTDTPPLGVQLVFQDYTTQNCACMIKDAACLGCGNVVGYHVTHPCESCLDACNNGISYNSFLSCHSHYLSNDRSFLDVS